MLVNRKSEGLNLHFPRYILNDHIHRSSAYHAFFSGKIIGHIDGEERIFLSERTSKAFRSTSCSPQPPPIVPKDCPSALTHMIAPVLTGVEPLRSTTTAIAFFLPLCGVRLRKRDQGWSVQGSHSFLPRESLLRQRISSDKMEMAISSVVTAPMSKPIGVWI